MKQMTAPAGQGPRKGEHSSIAAGSANLQPLQKSVWEFFRMLGIDLPQDPAIPCLAIYPKDSTSDDRDIYPSTFIAALLIISRNWKWPGFPSKDNENLKHLCNGILLLLKMELLNLQVNG
jgi:hypothetical protein